jgi:hypothetical protein
MAAVSFDLHIQKNKTHASIDIQWYPYILLFERLHNPHSSYHPAIHLLLFRTSPLRLWDLRPSSRSVGVFRGASPSEAMLAKLPQPWRLRMVRNS